MNIVNPEIKVRWIQEPSKTAAIKQKWNNYVESATLHGIQHVFTSAAMLRRIIWAVFLLAGIGYFSFQCTVLVKKYFSYPVSTKVTLEHESSPEFPAVTICNFNMLRQSKVDTQNLSDIVKYALGDKFAGGLNVDSSKIDWSRYKNLSMSNLYAVGGHRMEDMLTACSWKGEKCSHRNFTSVLTSMGLCHTFNSGKLLLEMYQWCFLSYDVCKSCCKSGAAR